MSGAKAVVVESGIWNDMMVGHSGFHDALQRGVESDCGAG